jgi:hypothetical protein
MRDTTFIPQDYDVFAGLDVSKKSIAATFTGHHGFIRSLQMPHSVDYLLNHVRKHFVDQKIAFVYEAGPTGYGLYDGLAAHGYSCMIAAPSMIPRAPGQRVKTNRLDSRGLSRESARGSAQKHSCCLSRVTRASPPDAVARHDGAPGSRSQAADQSPVVARRHRISPSGCRQAVDVESQGSAEKA